MRLLAVLLVLAFLTRHFVLIVAVVLMVGLVYFTARLTLMVCREVQAETAALTAARAALAARCDEQHAWVMAGDPRGIYGETL